MRCLKLLMENLKADPKAGGIHLALNMYDPGVQGLTVEEIQSAMGLGRAVTVPRDTAAVLAAVNRGQSLRAVAPQSPVLKSVAQLVDRLVVREKQARVGTAVESGSGIFSWFRRRSEGGK
jgi:Flp pilus assembly CpaE family ATPase